VRAVVAGVPFVTVGARKSTGYSWADPRSKGPCPHDERCALIGAAPAAAYPAADVG